MSAQNLRWALSGGIASGKSQVRELISEHGVLTIDADSVGHRVLHPDGPAFSAVAATWPEVVRNGEIDRRALASIVFDDTDELAVLESITHPHIFDKIEAQVEGLEAPVVVEVPLLAHGLGDHWRRIVVDAEDSMRLKRAVARGGTPGDVSARMAAQPSRSQWLAAADLVVPNHSTITELHSTVAALVPKL